MCGNSKISFLSSNDMHTLRKMSVRSKRIADTVEALIGAYLGAAGEQAAFVFLKSLGLDIEFHSSSMWEVWKWFLVMSSRIPHCWWKHWHMGHTRLLALLHAIRLIWKPLDLSILVSVAPPCFIFHRTSFFIKYIDINTVATLVSGNHGTTCLPVG